MTLNERQQSLCRGYGFDYSGLSALFVNGTLQPARYALQHLGYTIPAHGNQRSEWDAGCRFDHPNPDCR